MGDRTGGSSSVWMFGAGMLAGGKVVNGERERDHFPALMSTVCFSS